jgi:GNAT superfamily N-acetyltransferase
VTTRPAPAVQEALSYRPVRPDELEPCAEIWRVSVNDYLGRLNQPDLQTESGPLVRLYGHLQATDPDRFVVATRPDRDAEGGERIVAFAAAVARERLWFLSMCFVLPEIQKGGVGRALVARIAPADEAAVRATATDSAQPVSNALYASLGIVPRVPLLNLIGLPIRPAEFGELPAGVTPTRIDGDTDEAVDALDREVLGVAHPQDHRYLRREGRTAWRYHGPDGALLAYGYATEAGRIGPVASRDAALLPPILGHLSSAVTARGAFAIWLPGTADNAVVQSLRAGFRLEQFPILLCWDRPFADLTRYLPISPGLL